MRRLAALYSDQQSRLDWRHVMTFAHVRLRGFTSLQRGNQTKSVRECAVWWWWWWWWYYVFTTVLHVECLHLFGNVSRAKRVLARRRKREYKYRTCREGYLGLFESENCGGVTFYRSTGKNANIWFGAENTLRHHDWGDFWVVFELCLSFLRTYGEIRLW